MQVACACADPSLLLVVPCPLSFLSCVQAMDLTVGLQRRKEARVQAEQSKATDAKSKVNQKANSARLEEETKQRQQRDADRAYRELLGEAPKKAADATSASNKKTVNKTTSQKK